MLDGDWLYSNSNLFQPISTGHAPSPAAGSDGVGKLCVTWLFYFSFVLFYALLLFSLFLRGKNGFVPFVNQNIPIVYAEKLVLIIRVQKMCFLNVIGNFAD